MKRTDPVSWDPHISAVENARARLPELAAAFFARGREAARKKAKVKTLHQFRLDVKRFRYTLELFEPIYGPALHRRLARLRQLQSRLGAISDTGMTRELIVRTGGKKSVLVRQLLERLAAQEKSRRAKFVKYWEDTFDAPQEEERWVRYLKSFAGRRGSAFNAKTA